MEPGDHQDADMEEVLRLRGEAAGSVPGLRCQRCGHRATLVHFSRDIALVLREADGRWQWHTETLVVAVPIQSWGVGHD